MINYGKRNYPESGESAPQGGSSTVVGPGKGWPQRRWDLKRRHRSLGKKAPRQHHTWEAWELAKLAAFQVCPVVLYANNAEFPY